MDVATIIERLNAANNMVSCSPAKDEECGNYGSCGIDDEAVGLLTSDACERV